MVARLGLTPRRALVAGALAVLLLGALVPVLRPVAAVAAIAGWTLLRAGRRPEAVAWAAVAPVALALASPWALGGDVPLGDPACTDPLSPIVIRRVTLAAGVLGLVALLGRVHRSSPAELGLRRTSRLELAIAAGGGLALAVGGLVVGPAIARPFFGALAFPVPAAAAAPALVFGVANGVLEEVAYRGALQGWLGRVVSARAALGVQALAFGIAHAGPDVVALLPVHVALLTLVGLAGGIVRLRTGSLAIPIGIHVGADVALYVGLACRAG